MSQPAAQEQAARFEAEANADTVFTKFWKFLRRRPTLAFLLCMPLLGLVFSLIVYPFFYSIYLSMLNRRETRFVEFANYLFLFKRDTFWMVVRQSVLFTLTAVFFKALIGFIMAHLIDAVPTHRQRVWRGLALIPWVMPPALSTLGWWWLFDPSHSALNWILHTFFGTSVPWLSETFWARFCVILVNIWWGTPFFLIMYLAALKSVPANLYEAASIDGANAWQKLIHVTIPMLRNIIAITMLFSTIVTFANFDIVRVLTQGGPRNTTHLFGTYAFSVGIMGGDIPLGACVSLFMFPVLAVAAFFILRSVQRRVREI
jgi:multiple sugar transport system permease protein